MYNSAEGSHLLLQVVVVVVVSISIFTINIIIIIIANFLVFTANFDFLLKSSSGLTEVELSVVI